jgi:hypothetical protein
MPETHSIKMAVQQKSKGVSAHEMGKQNQNIDKLARNDSVVACRWALRCRKTADFQ